MKKSTHKRLTAWLLTLALVVTLLPGMGMTALAAEDGGEGNGPPAVEAEPVTEPEPQPEPEPEPEPQPELEPQPEPEPEEVQEEQTARRDAAMAGTGDYPAATAVSVDGGKSFGEPGKLYFKNGDSDDKFTGTSTNYNAWYNPNTGMLTLRDYNGKGITVGGANRRDITIVLIGTNRINNDLLDSDMGGDITVTSSSGGTLSIYAPDSDNSAAWGIVTGYGNYNTGSVTITGNAHVKIDVTINSSEKAAYRGKIGWRRGRF